MLAKTLPALQAALLVIALPVQAAQNGNPELTAEVVVEGLALDDLLNIRATASATGMVIGRLPNGSALKNFGCDEVNGYTWCRIAALENEKLHGWTPARYLLPVEGSGPVQAELSDASAQAAGSGKNPAGSNADAAPSQAAVPSPAALSDGIIAASAEPVPVSAAAGASPATEDAPLPSAAPRPEAEVAAVPADLSARIGDSTSGMLAYGGEQVLSSTMESDALASAVRTALAASGKTAGEGDAVPLLREVQPPAPTAKAAQSPAAAKAAQPAPSAEAAQSAPAAKPARAEAGLGAAPAPLASAEPRGTKARSAPVPVEYDASGEIPCARYYGQAMTLCAAAVARTGADAAEVTVTLPDGGKRTIHFRGGQPEGSNSRGAFRFTREGDLNLIRIGTSERFEIPDALAFGD